MNKKAASGLSWGDLLTALRHRFPYQAFSRMFLIAATVIFIYLFVKEGREIDLHRIAVYFPLVLLAVALSFGHMALKSLSLFMCARTLGFHKPFIYFFKAYCISTFIEISTLSGKVGSDAFKYVYWKDASRSQRLKIILLFRLSNVPAVCYSLVLVLFHGSYFWLWFVLIAVVAVILAKRIKEDFEADKIRAVSSSFFMVSHLQAAALAICLFQFYLLLLVYETEHAWAALSGYVISFIVGSVSLLPLGLGAKDLTLLVQLKPYMAMGSILGILILQRVTGDFVTAGVGWILSIREISKKNVR